MSCFLRSVNVSRKFFSRSYFFLCTLFVTMTTRLFFLSITSSHFAIILRKCFLSSKIGRFTPSSISHLFFDASYRERNRTLFFLFFITFNYFLFAVNYVNKLYINVLNYKVYNSVLFILRLVFLIILCVKFRRIYFIRLIV